MFDISSISFIQAKPITTWSVVSGHQGVVVHYSSCSYHALLETHVNMCYDTLASVNEVTQRRAQLILGWVTVCGQVHHLST